MINKGFSLFVYTIYLQQYIDIVRCVIFLLFLCISVFLCNFQDEKGVYVALVKKHKHKSLICCS